MSAALLSKKDLALHPRGQVAKLVRIAKRAEAKADWIETLIADRSYGHVTPDEIAASRVEVDAFRDRALAAANELCRIVVENPDVDWTLPQRRAAAVWERER